MHESDQMAYFHPVKLIEEVKKRPGLYLVDKHVDREQKLALWKEVGEAIYKDWAECSKATVYDRVLQIQRKWRSLRDAYNRELRVRRRSGPRINKRVYIYFRRMSFLGGFEGSVEDAIRLEWVKACNRPDLYLAYKKNPNILEHKYVCGLHFEKHQVMKRKLKGDAIPTLNLPKSSDTVFEDVGGSPTVDNNGTETALKMETNKDSDTDFTVSAIKIEVQDEEMTTETNEVDDDGTELQVFYKQWNKNENVERAVMISRGIQVSLGKDKTGVEVADPLDNQANGNDSEMTFEQFRKACDKFLTPHLSYYVKTQLVE